MILFIFGFLFGGLTTTTLIFVLFSLANDKEDKR